MKRLRIEIGEGPTAALLWAGLVFLLSVLGAMLIGCAQLDAAARHIPPGKYEVGFEYGDDNGLTYGGHVSYTKESETEDEALYRLDATDRRAQDLDPKIRRRLPTKLRVKKPIVPPATADAETSPR